MSLERIVADLVEEVEHRYWGKYRGFVVNNQDPAKLGRLRVRVPSVLGTDVVTGWAMPCVPYGGAADQGFLFIPERGAGVWVEFEEGDLEFPIWVGTFWSKPNANSELPKPRPDKASESEQVGVQDPPTRKIIKTRKGHTLQFEDADGKELVTLFDGANKHVVTLDANGIQITDGRNGHKIVMGASEVVVQEKSGNKIVVGPSGVHIGGGKTEYLLLGTTFQLHALDFNLALGTHTHLGNLGAPTSPPTAPLELQVKVSSKHTVE